MKIVQYGKINIKVLLSCRGSELKWLCDSRVIGPFPDKGVMVSVLRWSGVAVGSAAFQIRCPGV